MTDGMSFSYRVPTAEDALLGTSWTEPEFDDSSWTTTSGVGLSQGVGFIPSGGSHPYQSLFATDVGDAMRQQNASIWLRQEFPVDDPAAFAGLTLRMQYNDGFVAHLNGVPVASANAPESLPWNAKATSVRSPADAVVFQDFFIGPDTAGLAVGNNVLAIQGLNQLVDDTDLLIRPQLLGAAPIDVDLATGTGFLSRPTPGLPNTLLRTAIVAFDHPSGVLEQPFTLNLSADMPGATIHFTTDGSTPSLTSPIYTEPILIAETTYVQAIAVAPGFAAGAPLGVWFVKVDHDLDHFTSNLPVIVLDNFAAGQAGETTFQFNAMAIYEPDEVSGRSSLVVAPALESRVGLKIRGSNSAGKPKRHYAVEAWDEYHQDLPIAPLGMPADSDWILLPSYDTDRALIDNAFPFEVTNQMGRYAPRLRFVEVYHNIDGGDLSSHDYQGVYILIEKIKRGPNRVDIVELQPQDESEPEISGGWLLKDDRPDPGDQLICGLACVDPKEEEVTPTQAAWIRDYLTALKAAAKDPDPETGYAKYIDVDSWIDFHVLNVMVNNTDVFSASLYSFKDRGGKMEMGPIWDFDRSLGYEDTPGNAPDIWREPVANNKLFLEPPWIYLFEDPNFWQKWTDRWFELRQDVFSNENLFRIIDTMVAELAEAQERNFQRWPEVADRGGKMEMGPIWDFDRSLGYEDTPGNAPDIWREPVANNKLFLEPPWIYLFEDPNFWQKWTDRWFELRQDVFSNENLFRTIDTMVAELAEAQERNFQRWPEVAPDGGKFAPEGMKTWEAEILHMKGWLATRLAFIDSQFVAPPAITPAGGTLAAGERITLSTDVGTVYYTTDGTDPRLPGGAVDPNAKQFNRTEWFLDGSAPATYWFPTGASSEQGWQNVGFADSDWHAGHAALGFDTGVQDETHAFTVREVHSAGTIADLASADALLAGTAAAVLDKTMTGVPRINYLQSVGDGHFGTNESFPFGGGNDFVIRATTTLVIDVDGTYTFGINSDDGSRLRIDGADVIVSDWVGSRNDYFGTVFLPAGAHELELVKFQRSGAATVELFWAPGTQTAFGDQFGLLADG
ncbi:MAG: hypothetical protein A2W31_01295, partial [Planctomycetes bacterium RBG_16_64_10]